METNDYFLGIDTGGTKCAVLSGTEQMEILHRTEFATHTEKGPDYALSRMFKYIAEIRNKYQFGISQSFGAY